MSDKSKIEWCDATWNVLGGCIKVSEGCENCYALRVSWHLQRWPKGPERYRGIVEKVDGELRWTGRVNVDYAALERPLHWKKPRRIFVQSVGDLFHPDVPGTFIDRVMEIVLLAPQHTFMVLTKRAQRMFDYFYGENPLDYVPEFPKNLWVGVSVENQARADERIPLLLQTPAAVRFVSIEPMLGPVDLSGPLHGYLRQVGFEGYVTREMALDAGDPDLEGAPYHHSEWEQTTSVLNWVIVGGETGPEARPMHPDWARSVRDQCQETGTPFFFKSWGEWRAVEGAEPYIPWLVVMRSPPETQVPGSPLRLYRVGSTRAGRLLDGREWNEVPE